MFTGKSSLVTRVVRGGICPDGQARVFRVLLLGVIAAVSASVSSAGVILTNLGAPPNGLTSISGASSLGVAFTVTGPSLQLTDAQFDLFNGINGQGANPIPSSGLNVGIFADNAGQPIGSALVTLGVTTDPIASGEAVYTATPNATFILASGSTYWLILNDPTASLLDWQNTNTTPTTNGVSYVGTAGGVVVSGAVSGFFSPSGPALVQLDAVPAPTGGGTPEPGTLFLVAGMPVVFAMRRARRS